MHKFLLFILAIANLAPLDGALTYNGNKSHRTNRLTADETQTTALVCFAAGATIVIGTLAYLCFSKRASDEDRPSSLHDTSQSIKDFLGLKKSEHQQTPLPES